jgi:hypothetical protein
MNYTFGTILSAFLLCFVSVTTHAASSFDCTEKNNGIKAEVIISGADDEKLKFESKNKKIAFTAILDEAEESSYFYMTDEYTIVVSTDLFSLGKGNVSIEEDGEVIDSGSFYCESKK